MKTSRINWMLVVAGVFVSAAGLVWALQGAGIVGGSAMSGASEWIVIGCVVFAVGLGLIYRGWNRRRTKA